MHYCYRDDETHAARWYEPRKEYLYLKDERCAAIYVEEEGKRKEETKARKEPVAGF